jgi:protein SCO1/2
MNKRLASWLVRAAALLAVVPCLADDPHAEHRRAVVADYTRSVRDYRVPELELVRADGATVVTSELFATDRPVVVSFIFTSCTPVCPVLTATLAQARQRLGTGAGRVRMLSVSIDPEHDTPARLREYARQFQAGGDWQFFTGSRAAIVALQKAFDAYRGDKNQHAALALVRPAGRSQWARLEGFTGAEALVAEIQRRPGP